jgi:hypothetical protein
MQRFMLRVLAEVIGMILAILAIACVFEHLK